MGEKGDIKNLYKAWRLFLEEQKRKKKLKNKKTSKIKVFFVTIFTFLLSPFFFSKNNKKSNLKKDNKEIKKIDILIEKIKKEDKKEALLEIKKEIKTEKQKLLSNINKVDYKQIDVFNKAEKMVEEKIIKIENNQRVKQLQKNQPEISKVLEIQNNELEEKEILKSSEVNIENKILKSKETDNKQIENSKINLKTSDKHEEIKFKDNLKKLTIPVVLPFLIKSKKTLKDTKIVSNQIDEIEKKPIIKPQNVDILEFLNYMNLEISTIESKLKEDLDLYGLEYLQSRIIELNNKRDYFKQNYDFETLRKTYKSKDKYHILENNDILEYTYKKCNKKINKIKEEKPEEEKQEPEEIDFKEIIRMNNYLQKKIAKQQLQVYRMKLELSMLEDKLYKPTLLIYIKHMLRKSLNFCLNLMPIGIFKNRMVGGLVSAFMFNNSIRSIRNLVNKEQIEYARLLNNINNQKDLIFNIRLVYEDAITQIEFLKYDLLDKFSVEELKEVFSKMYEIEEEVKRKNRLLSNLEKEIEKTYEKTRQKVKKYVA